jgi:hypothetical protein
LAERLELEGEGVINVAESAIRDAELEKLINGITTKQGLRLIKNHGMELATAENAYRGLCLDFMSVKLKLQLSSI